jgi:hypothetical protein
MSLESTVISFVPFEIKEHKPGLYPPHFHIEASDMKTPQLLHIGTCYHFLYMDETRGSIRVPNPSDQVARAIVEDYITSQLSIDDEARPALFWVPERMTIEEIQNKFKIEIMRHLLKQKKWFLNVAMLADNDWSRYHQHNVISSFQRKCADYIGWKASEHEWMSPLTTMESSACPACGMTYAKGIVICPNCKLILDKEKAKDFEFAVSK